MFFFILHLSLFLTYGVADEADGLIWVIAQKRFRKTALEVIVPAICRRKTRELRNPALIILDS